eukprot:459072_1
MSTKKKDIRNFFSKLNPNQRWDEHKKKSKLLSKQMQNKKPSSSIGTKRKRDLIGSITTDNRPNKRIKINTENNDKSKSVCMRSNIIESNTNSNNNNKCTNEIEEKSFEEMNLNTNKLKNESILDKIYKFATNDINEYEYSEETQKLQFNCMNEFNNIIKIVFSTKTTSNYYCLFHLLEHKTDSLYQIVTFHGWHNKTKITKQFEQKYYTKINAMKEFQKMINQKIKTANYEIDTNIHYDISENNDSRFPIFKENLKEKISREMYWDISNNDIENKKDEYIEKLIKKLERTYELKSGTLKYETYKNVISKFVNECLESEEIKQKVREKKMEEIERNSWKLYEDYEIWMSKITTTGMQRYYGIKIEKHTQRESYKVICYWGETMWSGTTKVDWFDNVRKAVAKYNTKKRECIYGGVHRGNYSKGGYKEFDIKEYRKNLR